MGLPLILRELLLPPRCSGCGALQRPTLFEARVQPFCPACRKKWEAEKRTVCEHCGREAFICRCIPPAMKERYTAAARLAFYGEGEKYRVASYMVTRLKRCNAADTVELLATEAQHVLTALYSNACEETLPVVITHLPRTRRSVRRFGHDQAKVLAMAMADKVGLPYKELLYRARDGKPQKKLTRRERQQNIKGAFEIKESPRGLAVIVIDDIVTTGAGMREAAQVLSAAGAVKLFAFSCVTTPLSK